MPRVLISPVEVVANLRFVPWAKITRRPMQCKRVVRYGFDNRYVLVDLGDGRFASSQIDPSYMHLPDNPKWAKQLLTPLVKMKVITQQDMDNHVAACERNKKNSERRSDARELLELLERYGKDPIKALKKELNEVRRDKKLGIS